jgi:radical SAM superfamily enzyme YgiQ (UPF0313 family)
MVSKGGTLYYPIWLAYATGVLAKEGFDVELVDVPARDYDLDYVKGILKNFSPNLVVINTSTPSIYNDINICEELKKILPDSFYVLVGRHVSALPEETMGFSEKIDGIAIGEYDHILRDLALVLKDGKGLETVKGLMWRKEGGVVRNEAMPAIDNLDNIPFVSKVYKKHLNISDYFYGHSRYPVVTIVTSRGCPYQCFYCCYPQTMFGHKLRLRSPENVAEEFKYIADNFPRVREIMIEDDTFAVNKQFVNKLADLLIRQKNRIPFSANSRADLVDLGLLKKLKKAGCRLFCVGYESGVQRILDNMKKGLKIEKALEFSKAAKKAKIMVHGCFMVGNPGETKETMEETLLYVKKINPDTAQFYPIMVYPGTEAYSWAKQNNYLRVNDYDQWITKEGLHSTVVNFPNISSNELVEFCNRARREFYLRPKYIFNKIFQSFSSVFELKRDLKGFKSLIKYLFQK